MTPPDYIFIDCPPSLGLLTINAWTAAREILVPIQCEYYALEGVDQLLKYIDLVRKQLNPSLELSTILLTMYDGRTRLAEDVVAWVREKFPMVTLKAVIPRAVRVSEAPSFNRTVITHDRRSPGAIAYLEAAIEIANRGAQLGR
jgi:chromosome partitioning protein